MKNSVIKNHAEVMTSLANEHSIIAHLIGSASFHYVDMPVYGNIGDLLIMHGTLAFFKKNQLAPKTISPVFAFNPAWIKEDDVVVFQGGGNFGDLYCGMQQLREKVVLEKPNNRIVILPQTIHFSAKEEMEKSMRKFREHNDVHICVRDNQSYELAKQFTDNVYLLPDMAHHLYPIISTQPNGTKGNLLVSRTDGEKQSQYNEKVVFDKVTDWPEFVGNRERNFRFFYLAMRLMYRSGLGIIGNKIFASLWIHYANALINDAIKLFSGYEHIYTDRLHGHILACLMSKTNCVIDNNYGKNSGYVEVWTGLSDIVVVSES